MEEYNESGGYQNRPGEIAYDDNRVIWAGSPSQWVNAPKVAAWFLLIAGALYGRYAWYQSWVYELPVSWPLGGMSKAVDYIALGAMVLPALVLGYHVLYVLYERTTITTNKIEEQRGITDIFRKTKHCELAKVLDIESPPAGILALVGIADIELKTSDEDQPIIRIRGLRNRDKLVETILPIWRALRKERREYFSG